MRRVALSRRIIFGFSAGLLLQLLLSIAAYRNLVALMGVNRWVVHTEDMLATLENLFAQAQDAEVERGYLLTGDQLFLTPYQTARQEILPTLQRLQQLTSDNPLSQSRIVTLESLLKQRHIMEVCTDHPTTIYRKLAVGCHSLRLLTGLE